MRRDLDALLVFEAVWREGHVGRAAERLGMSQPAVSHALNRLRDRLGDPLFVRSSGGMRPTAIAEALWPQIADAIVAADAVFDREGGGRTRPPRAARVAMSSNVASVLLPKVIGRLAQTAPLLDLRVLTVDRRTARPLIERGDADAFVGWWPGAVPKGYGRTRLRAEPYVLGMRRGHPAESGTIGLRQLADMPQILVSPAGDEDGPLDRLLNEAGLQRRIVLVVPDFPLAAMVVAATDLVCLFSESFSRTRPFADALAFRPMEAAPSPWPLDLVVSPASKGRHWLSPLLSALEGAAQEQ